MIWEVETIEDLGIFLHWSLSELFISAGVEAVDSLHSTNMEWSDEQAPEWGKLSWSLIMESLEKTSKIIQP